MKLSVVAQDEDDTGREDTRSVRREKDMRKRRDLLGDMKKPCCSPNTSFALCLLQTKKSNFTFKLIHVNIVSLAIRVPITPTCIIFIIRKKTKKTRNYLYTVYIF
jgi:hypothetical protein